MVKIQLKAHKWTFIRFQNRVDFSLKISVKSDTEETALKEFSMRIMDEWLPFLHKDIEVITVDDKSYQGFFNDIDWAEDTDLDCELIELDGGFVFRLDEIKEIKLAESR